MTFSQDHGHRKVQTVAIMKYVWEISAKKLYDSVAKIEGLKPGHFTSK